MKHTLPRLSIKALRISPGHCLKSGVFLMLCLLPLSVHSQETRIRRELLVQDIRQFAHLLETVHPDPYINGGGKIAFHRRLHALISSIPDSGLTPAQFAWQLQRFAGWLGDPHTSVTVPLQINESRPGGIPIYLNVVEDKLYTYGYTTDKFDPPLGSVLLSVEGIPVSQIVKRHGDLTGNKNNVYNVLALLRGSLWSDFWLAQLLPEWTDKRKIRVQLKHPGGRVKEYTLDIPSTIEYPLHYPTTKVAMPSTQKCDFAYRFLDDRKETVVLRIDAMTGYREAFEIWRARGRRQLIQQYKGRYQRANGTPPPEDEDELIAGIPSATETFISLLGEMKEAKTRNLIIDLRRNNGGSSTMADILVYLIYGEEELLSPQTLGREVRKLSEYYFDLHTNESLDTMSAGKVFPLTENDYLFAEDEYGWTGDLGPRLREIARADWRRRISEMPTFKKIYEGGTHAGTYRPPNVAVISSSNTFSAGWTLMYKLASVGALIIGRPSGQEPNAFGAIQEYTLSNSRIKGYVSHMRYEYFPEDSESAHVIKPRYEMTYEALKSYDFDQNADILWALRILSRR